MRAVQPTAANPIVMRRVFAAGGIEYTWGDVVAAARLRGDWTAVRDSATEGLAARAELHARGESIDATNLRAAGTAFRYEHDLFAADELLAWLGRWELTTVEWTDWLGRALARERLSGESGDVLARHRPDPDQIETAAGVDAVFSGALERWARDLAQRAALALATAVHAAPMPAADPPPARGILALGPADWEAAAARVAPLAFDLDPVLAEIVDASAIEREVQLHRLDWLAFDCRLLRFPAEGMAREALLCLREDGLAFADVGALASVEPERVGFVMEDLPERWQAAFLGARDGEVVGPLVDGGGYAVVVVDGKRAPDGFDGPAAVRARKSAVDRALRREVEFRVRWYERV